MSLPDEVSLAFHVSETCEIFSERAERERQSPHPFQQVVGIETNGDSIGQAGEGVREFSVPGLWAARLVAFARAFVYEPDCGSPLPPPISNCHGLATFMTTGLMNRERPPQVMQYTGKALQPAFGEHIMLGYAIGEDKESKAHGRHSALGLGEQAPGECLQMTADDGVLAIDSLAAIQTFYENDGHAPYPHFWFHSSARPKIPDQKTIKFVSR
jgi:hypothetical protein